MADVPEECAKSGNSKDSLDGLENEQVQDGTKAKSTSADSEYESAEEDESGPVKAVLDPIQNKPSPDSSSETQPTNQEAATEDVVKMQNPAADSTKSTDNNLSLTEEICQIDKCGELDSPLIDSPTPNSEVKEEEKSLPQADDTPNKPLDGNDCSSQNATVSPQSVTESSQNETVSSQSITEELSATDNDPEIQEIVAEFNERIEDEDKSSDEAASSDNANLSVDLKSNEELTARTVDSPETLETYPSEEDQTIIDTDMLVGQEEFVTARDSDENDEKQEMYVADESSVQDVNGAMEETESLDAFCGGSTSGDLIDEEGGMEGAAEVEDGDCQFLEEEEEDDGEAEEHEETDDAQEYAEGERQQGDGEESVSPCPSKEKVLDDDEDRRNPQYIPKKGSFYEHDDRAGSEAEEDKEQKEKDKKKTKKLWSDDGRWGHDMFREEEQAPKSREELIACYGYDIRSEDGPPRARRRRRYGRGPNKYTRNWQDEDAYVRGSHEGGGERADSRAEISPRGSRGSSRGSRIFRGNRGRRGKEGFADFTRQTSNNNGNNNNNDDSLPRRNDCDKEAAPNDSMSYSTAVNNNKNLEPTLVAEEFPALPSKDAPVEPSVTDVVNANDTEATAVPASPTETQVFRTLTFENSRLSGRSDNREPPRGRGRNIQSSVPNQERRGSYARGRRGGNRGGPPKGMGPGQLVESEDLYNLQAEMEKMKIQDASLIGPPVHRKEINKERISSASQESSSNQKINEGRPKRYSSLRQRGIQEQSNYQSPQAQAQYYEPGYPGQMYGDHLPPSTQHQPSASSPVNPLLTNAYPGNYNPAPYQDTFSAALRAPMPNPPRLYHPTGPGQPVVASPYLPPNIAPNGALMNYGGPPPPPPAAAYPPQFQLLQPYGSPQPVPPTPNIVAPQTHELYTGGITYYNPHGQQYMTGSRTMPQKRPKAAIPIVPPPESQVGGGYDNFNDSRNEVIDSSSGVLEVES